MFVLHELGTSRPRKSQGKSKKHRRRPNSIRLERKAFHLDWAVIRRAVARLEGRGVDHASPQLATRFTTSIGLESRHGITEGMALVRVSAHVELRAQSSRLETLPPERGT